MTAAHEEKETLSVEVEIPEHADRGAATPPFLRTKKILMERVGGRCYVCNGAEAEVGPLQAHHCPVERSLAEAGTGRDSSRTARRVSGASTVKHSTGKVFTQK